MAEATTIEVGWPTRLETASATARVLARAWARIRAGDLDYDALDGPAEVEEARAYFGSRGVKIADDDGGEVRIGTATWPPRCAPRPAWFLNLPTLAVGTDDLVGADHATIVPPDDERFAPLLVHGNAPLAPEREIVGVVGPPYAPTPSGAHSCALAVLTARELVDELRRHADASPIGEAKAFRREADAYEAFALAAEEPIQRTCAPWLPFLPRVLPPESRRSSSPTPYVAASLRRA